MECRRQCVCPCNDLWFLGTEASAYTPEPHPIPVDLCVCALALLNLEITKRKLANVKQYTQTVHLVLVFSYIKLAWLH